MPSKISLLSKVDETNIDKLKARIDVVREGLISNPLDADLKSTINELTSEVRQLIFDETWINPLPNENWSLITNFILSLNEISLVSRKINRGLSFSAQRSAFVLLGYAFNHPQYQVLFGRNITYRENNLDLLQTMYGEAERQNYDPLLFGDLYAEGEWISDVMGYMSLKTRYSPNQDGVSAALRLWETFVSIAARTNPERLPRLFENLKDKTTSNLYGRLINPLIHPISQEFEAWKKMYKEIQPLKISNLEQHVNAIKVLYGQQVMGEWSKFNGVFGSNSQFIANTLPKIEDIWFECIQGSVFDSIAYIFGICAFHDAWAQLRECWYMSQPEDADAIYCDHEFFTRDLDAFASWVKNHVVPMDRTIYERHDLKAHMASACSVLIGDMLNAGGQPSFIFENIANAEDHEKFIRLLKTKTNIIIREPVRAAFGWDHLESIRIKQKVDYFLASELERCKDYIAENLRNCIPDTSLNLESLELNRGDRELVYEAWQQTNENFWRRLINKPAIKVSYLKDNLSDMDVVRIPFTAHESYFLSMKSGKRVHGLDFSGATVAAFLNRIIINQSKALLSSSSSKIEENSTWFICEDDWNPEGWKRLEKEYGLDLDTHRPIKISGEKTFILDEHTLELVLHEWTFMPWNKEGKRTVVSGFTDFSEFTTGIASVYYKLKVLKESGVHLLN